MASQAYKERLFRAVDDLPDEKVVKVVELAESLSEQQTPPSQSPKRPLGLYRGKIRVDPAFFGPLPDDLIRLFEGRTK